MKIREYLLQTQNPNINIYCHKLHRRVEACGLNMFGVFVLNPNQIIIRVSTDENFKELENKVREHKDQVDQLIFLKEEVLPEKASKVMVNMNFGPNSERGAKYLVKENKVSHISQKVDLFPFKYSGFEASNEIFKESPSLKKVVVAYSIKGVRKNIILCPIKFLFKDVNFENKQAFRELYIQGVGSKKSYGMGLVLIET